MEVVNRYTLKKNITKQKLSDPLKVEFPLEFLIVVITSSKDTLRWYRTVHMSNPVKFESKSIHYK